MACVFDIWVDNLMVLRDQKKFNDFFSTYFYQHHSLNRIREMVSVRAQ